MYASVLTGKVTEQKPCYGLLDAHLPKVPARTVLAPEPLAASFCLPACLLLSIGLLVYLSVYQHVNLPVYQSVFLYVSPSPTRLHTAGVSYIISVSFSFPFHYFSVYLSIKPTTKCTSSISDFCFRF